LSEKLAIEAQLFSISGVIAVKVTDSVVKVWTSKPELIPETIMGRKVEVYYTPPIKPLAYVTYRPMAASEEKRTAKWRPCPGGVSIGCLGTGGAGTLACRVFDLDGRKLLLSNFHVFTPRGEIDTVIVQPGEYDGGTEADKIGLGKRYVPIVFNSLAARNYADAAVAEPFSQEDLADEILDIGVVSEVTTVEAGDVVTKSGRSCGTKSGKVLETGVTVRVDGYYQGYAVFVNQIVTEPLLMPGDSGSLGVKDGKAFGLGFAGSTEASVFSPIKYVLSGLSVSFGEPEVPPEKKRNLNLMLFAPVGLVAGAGLGFSLKKKPKEGWEKWLR